MICAFWTFHDLEGMGIKRRDRVITVNGCQGSQQLISRFCMNMIECVICLLVLLLLWVHLKRSLVYWDPAELMAKMKIAAVWNWVLQCHAVLIFYDRPTPSDAGRSSRMQVQGEKLDIEVCRYWSSKRRRWAVLEGAGNDKKRYETDMSCSFAGSWKLYDRLGYTYIYIYIIYILYYIILYYIILYN